MIPAGALWSVVIAIVGLVLTILNIVDKITVFHQRAKEPDEMQNRRISALEETVKTLETRVDDQFRKYDEKLEEDGNKIDELEENMKKANAIIIRSLQSLASHAINGNDIESLKKSKLEIDEYLLNK